LKFWIIVIGLVTLAVALGVAWLRRENAQLPPGFASGNGRIEAVEYDIATKRPGRIAKVLAREGDRVEPGQVLVEMDVRDLQAELRQAEAELRRSVESRYQAVAGVAQKRSDIKLAMAAIAQRETELKWAEVEFERSRELLKRELIARQQFDEDQTKKLTSEAALAMEQARKLTADAARDAARAAIERIKTDIDDSRIAAPIHGRVLYRLAEPGEVLGAGGKVLTVLELTDVYMTIFLPTALAGQLKIGAEGRLVLDAAPDMVIPATVSFVAPRSQFTPREVETKTEREKLMFRVKVKIDPEVLQKNIDRVKTGLPGVAYVRVDGNTPWPARLQVRLPP
jgi:HlyD family secretion protein